MIGPRTQTIDSIVDSIVDSACTLSRSIPMRPNGDDFYDHDTADAARYLTNVSCVVLIRDPSQRKPKPVDRYHEGIEAETGRNSKST